MYDRERVLKLEQLATNAMDEASNRDAKKGVMLLKVSPHRYGLIESSGKNWSCEGDSTLSSSYITFFNYRFVEIDGKVLNNLKYKEAKKHYYELLGFKEDE